MLTADLGRALLAALNLAADGQFQFKGLLPTHAVWPELAPASPDEVAHIAVLAVRRDWRGIEGGAPFWSLCAAMWRCCVLSGVKEIWLEATPRALRCYQRLGWPLTVRGNLRVHWGEPCYPCSMTVREVAGSLTERAVRSPTYRSILLAALTETKSDSSGMK